MLVVGQNDHQRRIWVPLLQSLHLRRIGPFFSHLAPWPDGTHRADLPPHFAGNVHNIGIFVRRQTQVWLLRKDSLPLCAHQDQRQAERPRPLDRPFIVVGKGLLVGGRPVPAGVPGKLRLAKPRKQVVPLLDRANCRSGAQPFDTGGPPAVQWLASGKGRSAPLEGRSASRRISPTTVLSALSAARRRGHGERAKNTVKTASAGWVERTGPHHFFPISLITSMHPIRGLLPVTTLQTDQCQPYRAT